MRAVVYERFNGPIDVVDVAEPVAGPGEVVVDVLATGVCRSDVHGWRGTDVDIACPHVGGHEFVGRVVAAGPGVERVAVGQRVVAPFVCGCGACEPCRSGNPQVCVRQQQPGFTMWGSFAERCRIPFADHNAVVVPASVDDASAALVGCRVSTAHRALERGRLRDGEVLAVHGCGGVGLATIALGRAIGARVIAIDIDQGALELAAALGADTTVRVEADGTDAGDRVRALGGAHVSVDCLGGGAVASASIASLRPLGRHVQVGLFPGPTAELPISRVVRDELEVLGVHGQAAARFGPIFDLIERGRLDLTPLVTRRIGLDGIAAELPAMAAFGRPGIAVATP